MCCLTRRSALGLCLAAILPDAAFAAGTWPMITVHKDPNCGCCSGWAQHMEQSGFTVRIIETSDLDAVKKRLGVPHELASCHTAEIAGHVVEGHVPAAAVKRLLSEKLAATGLAVPGMPIGSPGMEGGRPETYDVVLFDRDTRRVYMRFIGSRAI